MRPDDLLTLVRDLYTDKLALTGRHEASARAVREYDFNNTYQYVISRENTHLEWLRQAIESLVGTTPDATAPSDARPAGPDRRLTAAIVRDDARDAEAFVARWREKVAAVTHARHRQMLQVILGETLEHKRFFDQAAAGRTDLLGRRTAGSESTAGVLPTRWVE